MRDFKFNSVDFLLEKLKSKTMINSELVACILLLCLGKTLDIYACTILDKGRLSQEQFINKLNRRLSDEGPHLLDTVEFLKKYGVSEEVFEITADEVLDSTFFRKEQLSDIIDYLINNVFMDRNDPELQTPVWLNRLAIAILNPVHGSFYDGVAGAGSTAIEAHRHARQYGGGLEIYTQEIYEFLYHVSVIRSFVEKIPQAHHTYGDTIREPKCVEHGRLKTFDYSIMFPPIGMKNSYKMGEICNDEFQRFSFNNNQRFSLDWLFGLHQLASLNDTGKGILCVSNGALFNAQNQTVRSELIRSGVVEGIVSLPANSLSYTAVPVNLVVLNKKRNCNDPILMVNAQELMQTNSAASNQKNSVLTEAGIERIVQIFNKREEINYISKKVPVNLLQEDNLLPTAYVKKIMIDTKGFGKVSISDDIHSANQGCKWIKLKDAAAIFNGINTNAVLQSDYGVLKIIQLSDVQDGRLDIAKVQRYRLKKNIDPNKYRVEADDIILSCKGSAIKLCMMENADDSTLISSNFFGLRAKTFIVDPLYLKFYLESPAGQYHIKSRQVGSSIAMINKKSIEELPIPYLPLEQQQKLVRELLQEENLIEKKIEALKKRREKARWKFYQEIGLSEIMERVE